MENKYLIAKLLGEVYKMQKMINPNLLDDNITDSEIFGLINSIEPVIDKKINEINSSVITNEEMEEIENILENWDRNGNISDITFWELEHKTGLIKNKIYTILKYLYLEGKYNNTIKDIISHGPSGYKNF